MRAFAMVVILACVVVLGVRSCSDPLPYCADMGPGWLGWCRNAP